MGDGSFGETLNKITPKPFRGTLHDPLGLLDVPKTPGPTAQELELDRKQRKTINELTRETNSRLKGIKRGTAGRQSLLGSGSRRGVTDDSLGGGGGSSGGPGRAASTRRRGGAATVGGGRRAGGIVNAGRRR